MRKYYTCFIVYSLLCFTWLVSIGDLHAQLALTTIGTPAVMNFDIPGSSSCTGATSPWVNNVTIPNCYSNQTTYAYSTGCNNTGALHVAGNGGETALGGRASNSTTTIIWGVRMVNNTGQPITALRIRYRGEQWNSAQSNVNNTVAFSYSISPTAINSVSTGTYTNFAALNMSSLVTAGGCGGGGSAIDGNQTFANIEACMPVNIQPGHEIMLRWYETNDACNDHMLCIDDLEVTPLNASLANNPITGTVSVCPHDSATYSVPFLSGVTYAWSGLPTGASYIGGLPSSHEAEIDWGTTAPGAYTITVTPTGSFCGITLLPVSLTVTVNNPTPVIITASPAIICPGQPVTLTSSMATGNTWNTSPSQSSQSITVNTAGVYVVTVTGVCGLPSDTIEIQASNLPVVDLGSDLLDCSGIPNFMLDAQNPGCTYLWQDGATNRAYQATAAGTYHVEVTSVCGSVSDTVVIVSQTLPVVNLGNDTSICGATTNILLDAENPQSTYLWQDNSITPTFTVTQPGHYYVSITNDCGINSDTLDVVSIPAPQLDLGPDQTICLGTPVTFDAEYTNASYLWHDGSTSAQFTTSQDGTYYVTVSNNCGQVTDSVIVYLKPGPQPVLNDTLLGCGITLLILDAQNHGASYVWSTGETSRTINIYQAGEYWVEMAYCGFTITDTARVDFSTPASTFFAPNSFTPNGDNVNDTYRVTGNFDDVTAFSAMIFNRWGELVFSATNPEFGWDGEYRGRPEPDGVYYATFSIKRGCSTDANMEQGTTLTLVR
jgi:gliding motility-associated-like protein